MQIANSPQDVLLIHAPVLEAYSAADCGNCDCACPMPMILPLSNGYTEDMFLSLHPNASFMPLHTDALLAYVPSYSTGVVVNTVLYEWLQTLTAPQSAYSLSQSLGKERVDQCVASGLLTNSKILPTKAASKTLMAWLHVTNACNLRCTYCYINKNTEAMSAETGYAAIDAVLRSALTNGFESVLLKYAGGEASLNLGIVLELDRYMHRQAKAQHLHYQGVLLSNGIGLTKARLTSIQQAGLCLMISLDGVGAINDEQRMFANGAGSFQAVANTIERALAIGLKPLISITVTGQSAGSLVNIVQWVLDRELRFSLNFYRENNYTTAYQELNLEEGRIIDGMRAAYGAIEQRLPIYSLLGSLLDRANLLAPHNNPCGVGENYLVIDHNGSIASCQMEIEQPLTSIKIDDPLAIIRLHPAGIHHIPVDERDGCRSCDWRYWCAGGCPSAVYRATGRYDRRSPNCRIYQALFPAVLRLEGLRILKYGISI